VKIILKYLLSAICIVYVLWGVDFQTLASSFDILTVKAVLVAQGILLLCLIPLSFRLVFITHGESNLLTSFRAVVIGNATNTLLPAKLGEIAKIVVFKKSAGMSTAHATGAVFWERFADLSCLLLIGIITATMLDIPLVLLPLALIVGSIWVGLILLKYKPQWLHLIVNRLPGDKVRNFIRQTMSALSENMQLSYYAKLGTITIIIWALFVGYIFYLLSTGTNLNLTDGQIMTVIIASILGVTIPSAPAGIGVYETLVVGALAMAGVHKEQALAIALALHVIQILIPTLLGICFMSQTTFQTKDLQDELPQ